MNQILSTDVLVIGAGPAGSAVSSMLTNSGHDVLVMEKTVFPRFSIGESLLPQCMVDLEKAGLLEAVQQQNFQVKDGANFTFKEQFSSFLFKDKFSDGPSTTYQVQRAQFDNALIEQAQKMGVQVQFDRELKSIDINNEGTSKAYFQNKEGVEQQVNFKFVVDASGFGRALPKQLDLDLPSDFPSRQSLFCHFKDNFSQDFDRQKILVAVHDENPDIWFWVIPFSDGTSSLGVVGEQKYFDAIEGTSKEKLDHFVSGSKQLSAFLQNAEFHQDIKTIKGYASNVKSLYGDNFVLLGNAGEFLDPVFSSGVTIALRSATLAAPLITKQLKGESVDWENEFSNELKKGVNTFKAFVESWYTGELQTIIMAPKPEPKIKQMICSILAGYTWDPENPYTRNSKRRLSTLANLIGT